MNAPLALPPPRPPRVPSVQLAWQWVRLFARLIWVWLEVAPGLAWLAFAAWWAGSFGLHALAGRWPLGTLAFTLGYTYRAWHGGEFAKNVGNTYEAIVAWDWRIVRLTNPTIPRLISVTVAQPYSIRRAIQRHKADGIWGIPAAAAKLEIRPHAVDLPTEAWAYQVEWWATARYAFSQWEPIHPAQRSPHVLVLDMGELVIPDAVTAGEWTL